MSGTRTKQVSDLPPSAKLVFKTLEYTSKGLTQQDIVARSRLPARTTRYALDRLESNGIVNKRINFADARQDLYELSP